MGEDVLSVEMMRNVLTPIDHLRVCSTNEKSLFHGSYGDFLWFEVKHVHHQAILVRLNDDLSDGVDVSQAKLDVVQPLGLFVLPSGGGYRCGFCSGIKSRLVKHK